MRLLSILTIIIVLVLSFFNSNDSYAKSKARKRRVKVKKVFKRSSQFQRNYGSAGCGLGAEALGKSGNQVLAATTNASFSSHVFGISSGTLQCVDGATDKVAVKVDNFIYGNQVSLASDMAKGGGESLNHIGSIMGCSDLNSLGQLFQKNFNKVFTHEDVTVMSVTDSIINIILQDKEVLSHCKHIG